MKGVFSIDSPEGLFGKVQRDYEAFYREPTIDGFFSLIFPLYHLREWVQQAATPATRQASEQLDFNLKAIQEYGIVRELCNHAKHLSKASLASRTEVLEGLRVGLGGCGDSLGITHFVVDNRDVRDIFWPVFQAYRKHFGVGP